jgi:hypothetical protein
VKHDLNRKEVERKEAEPMIRFCFMVLFLYLAGCTQVSGKEQQSISVDMLCPNVLVEARVITIDEQEGVINATLQISRIYKGEIGPGDYTFNVSANKSGEGMYGSSFLPPLKQGDIGIWLVEPVAGKIVRDLAVGKLSPITLPSRHGVDSRYAQTKLWAEAVEATSKASPENRLALLKDFAVSDVPEVSAWAVHAIANAKPQIATEAFYTEILRNGALSVGGQIALDEVLSEIRGDSWRISEERLNLLNRLVEGKGAEYEAGLIDNRLSVIAQHGEMDDRIVLNLLKKFADNQGFPVASRQNNIRLMGIISSRSKDEGMAFRHLIEVIQVSKEDEMKVAAAYTIKNFQSIDKNQLSIIQSLKATTTNKTVADALEEALKHPKNQ